MEVKQWVDPETEDLRAGSKAKLVENTYCRVWGKLKDFNGRKHVGAQFIRPLDDLNEISYHLLEATYVHLFLTKGPIDGAAGTGASGANANAAQGQAQATGGVYGGADLSAYSNVAKKVFKYLSEAPQTNEGLHQQQIAANIGVDTAEVARAGDDLLAGGLIYTTVDDQTWAVLEAD